jgi:hypothetical protein
MDVQIGDASPSFARKPDFSEGIHALPLLVSNRYVENSLKRVVADCPSLSGFEPATIARIANSQIVRARILRRLLAFWIVLYFIYGYALLRVSSNSFAYFTLWNLVLTFLFTLIVGSLSAFARRSIYEELTVYRLLMLIRIIEQNQTFWHESRFRWVVASTTTVGCDGVRRGCVIWRARRARLGAC